MPYLHSVRLIDELLKKGKGDLVSFMTYPGEFHYFTREHVLRDAWHRVEDFFDANLKRAQVASDVVLKTRSRQGSGANAARCSAAAQS